MNEIPLKVLFIDRDGTIIYEPDDFQVDDLKKIKFVPNVIRVLNELKNEGYSPNDEDFYDEIDKRMRAAFPTKFTKEEPVQQERNDGSSSPSQVVAGGSRSSPNPKKVKLSQEDVRLANKWGIPLEQYAAEKMKVTKSEGDYTTINMQRGGK